MPNKKVKSRQVIGGFLAGALLAGAAAYAGWRAGRRAGLSPLERIAEKLRRALPAEEAATFPPSALGPGDLDRLLDRLAERFRADRQFTQHAAHELQTPLAIIKGQVELLLQREDLQRRDSEALASILQQSNRLARINRALILLARIEHGRFTDRRPVDLAALTDRVLEYFQDSISLQGIEVRKRYRQPAAVPMSETLAEILLTNLLQNATRHNLAEDPYIDIELSERQLSIANPGRPLDIATERLFERFQRAGESGEGLGLGLSVVRRICDYYHFGLHYHHREGIHTLTVDFDR